MGFFKSIFKKKNKNHQFLIDRDLSWLKFNKRVLEEATNKNIPVLERIRFLSISGSNLDEFLMVRLAGLNRMQIDKIPINSLSGLKHFIALPALVQILPSLSDLKPSEKNGLKSYTNF